MTVDRQDGGRGEGGAAAGRWSFTRHGAEALAARFPGVDAGEVVAALDAGLYVPVGPVGHAGGPGLLVGFGGGLVVVADVAEERVITVLSPMERVRQTQIDPSILALAEARVQQWCRGVERWTLLGYLMTEHPPYRVDRRVDPVELGQVFTRKAALGEAVLGVERAMDMLRRRLGSQVEAVSDGGERVVLWGPGVPPPGVVRQAEGLALEADGLGMAFRAALRAEVEAGLLDRLAERCGVRGEERKALEAEAARRLDFALSCNALP